MGKAAERRNNRRQVYLSLLAQENPEKFKHEWMKRLKSWAIEINMLGKEGKIKTPSVFDVADRAKEMLLGCGDKAVELQYEETQSILENECCRVLAPHIGYEMYKINQQWKPDK